MPDDQTKLLQNLHTVSLFTGLPLDLVRQLAASAIQKRYPAGALVFLEGEQAEGLYYLDSGWIKVVKISVEGREQVLRFLSPGETFNEMGVFANRPNPATAIALEEVVVWVIPRQAMHQILITHPDTALRVVESMADRIVGLVTLVADLSLHTVEARLARLLLEQADENVVQRHRWTTQAELAARLGTVPDVLSRALRSLANEGIIALERHQIQILDRRRLMAKAGFVE
jgi:CRP/FNR family transcriptional regulator, dissimilatory nitrate respiration regulator